jgi:glucosamine-6-phosphate deaminase
VGVGENGHLAFNDPPADFETDAAYLVVNLDETCRRQQVGEGWFSGLDEVPKQALSMSVPQIMKSLRIVCTVPDARKAWAVKGTVKGPVTNLCPASILQRHPDCAMFLDPAAAAGLKEKSGMME